jgi:hypothetical protein
MHMARHWYHVMVPASTHWKALEQNLLLRFGADRLHVSLSGAMLLPLNPAVKGWCHVFHIDRRLVILLLNVTILNDSPLHMSCT